jgi:hypothetical protein
VASAVEKTANIAGKLPIIGPYATAAGMAAGGIGKLARVFGYSRPNMPDPPTAMRPTYVGNMVNGDVGDNAVKLSVDCNQNLALGPAAMGIGSEDELVVANIAAKESFLTTFPWTVSKGSGDLLWNIRVTPSVQVGTSVSTVYLPACRYASVPFRYWRGTMRYRFQVVSSGFHRGRLAFVWDPNYIEAFEPNIAQTQLVDISEEKDVVIDIKWGNPTAWLLADDFSASGFSTTAFNSSIINKYNGVLGVYVVNSLSVPNSVANNDITVLVSVSLVDGEFAVPDDTYLKDLVNLYSWTQQSGTESMEHVDGEVADCTNMPFHDTCIATLGSSSDPAELNLTYMGEVITSFRQLLKRYCYYCTHLCPTTTRSTWTLARPNYPLYRGYSADVYAMHTSGIYNLNYVANSIITYLMPAFVGVRGGMRWKVILGADTPSDILTNIAVERGVDGAYSSGSTTLSMASDSKTAWSMANGRVGTGFNGMQITPYTHQPVLEFETPFYANHKFATSRLLTGSSGTYAPHQFGHRITVGVYNSSNKWLETYVAAGEDFNLFYFVGCPPMAFVGLPAA